MMSFNLRKLSRKQTRACAASDKSLSFSENEDFEDFSFSLKRNVHSASTLSSTQPVCPLKKSRSETAFHGAFSEKVDVKLQQQARIVLERLENSPHRSKVKHCFRCHQSISVDPKEHESECPAGARTRTNLEVKRMLQAFENDTSPEIVFNVRTESCAVVNRFVSELVVEPIRSHAVSDLENGAKAVANRTGSEVELDSKAVRNSSEVNSFKAFNSAVSDSCVNSLERNSKRNAVFEIGGECRDPLNRIGQAGSCGFLNESGLISEKEAYPLTVTPIQEFIDRDNDNPNKDEDEEFQLRITPEATERSQEETPTLLPPSTENRAAPPTAPSSNSMPAPQLVSIYDKLPCPICCKAGSRGLARLKHIRSCAAKQGMNIGEMNAAIELQKKQADERLAAGLPVVSKPVEPRRPPVRRQHQPVPGADPDLDVALAISASMHEADVENEKLLEENMLIEAGLGDAVLALREESEPNTSKQTKAKSNGVKLVMTGAGSKSGVKNRLLLTLTKEQRENRTSERVAEILGNSLEVRTRPSRDGSRITFVNLEGLLVDQDKMKKLWNLSIEDCAKDTEIEDSKANFYIEEIRKLLSPRKKVKDSKDSLDIPGRLMTQLDASLDVSASDQATMDILVDLQDDPTPSLKIVSPKSTDSLPTEVSPERMTPSQRLSHDFANLLGRKEFSDSVAVLADNSEVFVHKLMLKTRVPKLVKVLMDNSKLDLKFLSRRGGLALLNYIYSAEIPESLGLTKGDESQLSLLAMKYSLPELNDVLKLMKMKESDDVINEDFLTEGYDPTKVGGEKRKSNGTLKAKENDDVISFSAFDDKFSSLEKRSNQLIKEPSTPENSEINDYVIQDDIVSRKDGAGKRRAQISTEFCSPTSENGFEKLKKGKKSVRRDSASSTDSLVIIHDTDETRYGADTPTKSSAWCNTGGGIKRPPTPDLFDDIVTVKRSKSDIIQRNISPTERYTKSQSFHVRRSEERASSISESMDKISLEAQRISNEVNLDIMSLRRRSLSVSSSQPSLSLLEDHRLEKKREDEHIKEEVIDLTTPEELRGCDGVDGSTRSKNVSRTACNVETAHKHIVEVAQSPKTMNSNVSVSLNNSDELFKAAGSSTAVRTFKVPVRTCLHKSVESEPVVKAARVPLSLPASPKSSRLPKTKPHVHSTTTQFKASTSSRFRKLHAVDEHNFALTAEIPVELHERVKGVSLDLSVPVVSEPRTGSPPFLVPDGIERSVSKWTTRAIVREHCISSESALKVAVEKPESSKVQSAALSAASSAPTLLENERPVQIDRVRKPSKPKSSEPSPTGFRLLNQPVEVPEPSKPSQKEPPTPEGGKTSAPVSPKHSRHVDDVEVQLSDDDLPSENNSYLESYDLSDWNSVNQIHEHSPNQVVELPSSNENNVSEHNQTEDGSYHVDSPKAATDSSKKNDLRHQIGQVYPSLQDKMASCQKSLSLPESDTKTTQKKTLVSKLNSTTDNGSINARKNGTNGSATGDLLPDDTFEQLLLLNENAAESCNTKRKKSASTAVLATTGRTEGKKISTALLPDEQLLLLNENTAENGNTERKKSALKKAALATTGRTEGKKIPTALLPEKQLLLLNENAAESCNTERKKSTSTALLATTGRTEGKKISTAVLPDDSFEKVAAALGSPYLKPSAPVVTPVRTRTFGKRKKKKVYPPVTPKPDYETMMTPELKLELDRFGLKPLKRKNAVKILNHIYEETHPFVTDSENEGEVSPIRRSTPSGAKKMTNSTQNVQASASSADEIDSEVDEIIFLEEAATSGDQPVLPSSQMTQNGNIPELLKQFVRGHPELYKKILRYEPIWLNELHSQVKEAGIKCSVAKLMDWLDDQGITFRAAGHRRSKKKSAKNAKEKSDSA